MIKMKFDEDEFRGIKTTEEYKKLVKDITEKGLDYNDISRFCASTQFSIIAMYYFIKEDFPKHIEACDSKITMLKEFYWYE